MRSEDLSSSVEILFVTKNAVGGISAQQSAESLVVATVSQDVEGNPAFTSIIWIFGVGFIEEQLKFRWRKAENAFVVELLLFLILSQKRSLDVEEGVVTDSSIGPSTLKCFTLHLLKS